MERHLFFALVAGLPSVLLALSLSKPHGVPPERRTTLPVDTPESSAESPCEIAAPSRAGWPWYVWEWRASTSAASWVSQTTAGVGKR